MTVLVKFHIEIRFSIELHGNSKLSMTSCPSSSDAVHISQTRGPCVATSGKISLVSYLVLFESIIVWIVIGMLHLIFTWQDSHSACVFQRGPCLATSSSNPIWLFFNLWMYGLLYRLSVWHQSAHKMAAEIVVAKITAMTLYTQSDDTHEVATAGKRLTASIGMLHLIFTGQGSHSAWSTCTSSTDSLPPLSHWLPAKKKKNEITLMITIKWITK